ncbi:MAG: HAD family hydrolase [Desulfotomaculales bacterium]
MLHGIYIFDADNTLWDTHRIYIEGYRHLLSFLQEAGYLSTNFTLATVFATDRTIIQAIGKYEYDVTVLAMALVYQAQGLDRETAINQAFAATPPDRHRKTAEQAARRFYAYQRDNPPPLFEGVRETLTTLYNSGNVLVLHSEGLPERVRETLAGYGLESLFHYLVLEHKSEASFRQAQSMGYRLYHQWANTRDGECIVVGDSPQRDIVYGNLIGARTVMKPGGMWGGKLPADPWQQPEFLIHTIEELLHLEPQPRIKKKLMIHEGW